MGVVLTDLTWHLAARERVLDEAGAGDLVARLEAAMPELSEDDRVRLVSVTLDAAYSECMEQAETSAGAFGSMLLLAGVEIGRELERRVR